MELTSKRKKLTDTEARTITGQKINGDDLMRIELTQIASEAETRYNEGKYVTHDKARTQSKNWGQSCGN